MSSGSTAHPLPAPVEELLAWWMPRIRTAVGEAFRSALLYGSVAMGDFQPGWSDVDVCIVREGPETDAQREHLAALKRETDARFLGPRVATWSSGQTIDPLVVPLDALERVDAFDCLSLSTCAHVLDGMPVAFPRPSRADVERRLAALLDEIEQPPQDASAVWFTAVIQLLARALVWWRDSEFVSKSAALEREIARGRPEARAYALALEIRRAGSASAAAHEEALRAAYAAAIGPALARLAAVRDPD